MVSLLQDRATVRLHDSATARLRYTGDVVEVGREIVLAAPAEEVWQALTHADRLCEWFANEVELDLRPGGEGVFRWDDGSLRRASVEVVEPERRFAFRWREEAGEAPATRVEITLAETPEGTRVSVTESAPLGPSALAGEWSWGLELLASLPRLRPLARA